MALLFRRTPDHFLRSIGDLPGIVGAGVLEDGPSFTVDSSWEPSAHLRALHDQGLRDGLRGIVTEASPAEERADTTTAVSIEDAVEACESVDELLVLLQFTAAMLSGAVAAYAPSYIYAPVVEAAVWARAARDAIVAAMPTPDG